MKEEQQSRGGDKKEWVTPKLTMLSIQETAASGDMWKFVPEGDFWKRVPFDS